MAACKLAIPMAWFLSILIPKLCHYIVNLKRKELERRRRERLGCAEI
jgi:hypothetical protein